MFFLHKSGGMKVKYGVNQKTKAFLRLRNGFLFKIFLQNLIFDYLSACSKVYCNKQWQGPWFDSFWVLRNKILIW